MPLQKLQFRPGVNREATTYANEGGWYESEKVRFRSGFPEKIGGWTNLAVNIGGSPSTFKGVARNIWNWVTLAFSNFNAIGTNQKYYIESGGQYNDITPLLSTTPTPGISNPIATTNASRVVAFNCAASHGATPGTFVTIASVTSGTGDIGGIPITEINGEHEIISTLTATSFTFLTTTAASSTVSSGGGTTPPTASFQIPAGNATYSIGNGWGSGTWAKYQTVTLTDPFTSPGSGSVLTVTQTAHGLATNDYVYFLSIASIPCGLNISSVTIIQKAFQITVTGVNAYTISTDIGGQIYTASSAAASGGTVVVAYKLAGDTRGWGTATTAVSDGIGQQLRLWSSDNFGEDLIFAPRQGSIYYWDTPGSASSFPRAVLLSSLAGASSVPLTTFGIIASDVQRFVIALGSNQYGGTTFDPMLVRWSDQESATNWTPSTSNQAGEYKLAGGSQIVTGRTARQEVLIWTDSALYTMQYLGPPYVWGFNLLMDNISIISPNATASVNNVTYWMGVDKFYSYSGRVETLPCTLRQFIFDDINQAQAYQIVAGTNEGYNEVWWFYPSANSTVNDKYVIYNHLERTWYYGTINRTYWLDSPLRTYPMGVFSVQNSYLASAISTTTQTSVTLINGYSYPSNGTITIDSEDITYTAHDSNDGNTLVNCTRGANGTTAATHTQYAAVTYKVPNQVMYHENGVDDNSLSVAQPIESYIQSSDFDIGDGHNFGFVWRMLPDVNFDGSTLGNPQVTITVRPRQNSGTAYGVSDSPTVTSANTYSPTQRVYNVQKFTGQVYTRIRGRQMAFRIGSTDIGTTWQLGTPRIDIRNDGRR